MSIYHIRDINEVKSMIPKDLKDLIYSYFGNDSWFYIRHPKLYYECPYWFLRRNPNRVDLVREIAIFDTSI